MALGGSAMSSVNRCGPVFRHTFETTWNDADITELLSFKPKTILAGDLNAKNPFWNSAVSNPSGDKLLHLFEVNEFEISLFTNRS
jgi:hypothetical protein